MSTRTRLLGVLWTTGGVSIACNVLAAESSLVARFVASWPPISLLLVVEVLARVDLPGRLRWIAAGGAVAVAVPAAVASFHHMHSVAIDAGESPLVAWLFPLTVDGLAVVASTALAGLHRTGTNSPDEHGLVDELARTRVSGVGPGNEIASPHPALDPAPPSDVVSVAGGVVFPPALNGAGPN